MRRKLFTLAAGVSAVLCVGVDILWLRSYATVDSLTWTQAKLQWGIRSNRGVIVASWAQGGWARLGPDGWRHATRAPSADASAAPDWRYAGLLYEKREYTYQDKVLRVWRCQVPLWFVAALCLVVPVCWRLRFRRDHQRARDPLCPRCGYDLRATPDRCPECGAALAKGVATA